MVFLCACSSLSGPVTVRDSTPFVDRASADDLATQANVSSSASAPAQTAPVVPRKAQAALPVIDSLIVRADNQLSRGDYNKAIDLAERGLRIDRQDARFYLVLASAYYQLENKQQSTAFARQGLRYVQRETTVHQQLKWFSK